MARRPPWDPVDNESAKAYAAFCKYRDMGPTDRSLNRLVSEGVGHKAELGRWSGKYEWVARARAWDVYVDQRRRERSVQRIISTNEKIADVAEAFRDILTLPIRAVVSRLDQPGGLEAVMHDLGEMDIDKLLTLAAQSARIIPVIVEIEQRALGVLSDSGQVYNGAASTLEPLDADSEREKERAAAAALVMAKHGLLLPPPKT